MINNIQLINCGETPPFMEETFGNEVVILSNGAKETIKIPAFKMFGVTLYPNDWDIIFGVAKQVLTSAHNVKFELVDVATKNRLWLTICHPNFNMDSPHFSKIQFILNDREYDDSDITYVGYSMGTYFVSLSELQFFHSYIQAVIQIRHQNN